MQTPSKYSVANNGGTITITDAKTGDVGKVYKHGNSYLVELLNCDEPNEDRKLKRAKRMQEWYFRTQVQQST